MLGRQRKKSSKNSSRSWSGVWKFSTFIFFRSLSATFFILISIKCRHHIFFFRSVYIKLYFTYSIIFITYRPYRRPS